MPQAMQAERRGAARRPGAEHDDVDAGFGRRGQHR
jgi:hypothetical protein